MLLSQEEFEKQARQEHEKVLSMQQGKFQPQKRYAKKKTFRTKFNWKSQKTQRGACHYCGMKGHWLRHCRNKKKDEEKRVQMAKKPFVEDNIFILAQKNEGISYQEWVLDSGSMVHLCSNSEYFDEITEKRKKFKWINNSSCQSTGIGLKILKANR